MKTFKIAMIVADIAKMIKDGNGTVVLTTVAGRKLIASMDGEKLVIKNERGGNAFYNY